MRRVLLAAGALALVGCSSPETGRTRGGGPGADVGNLGNPVEIHGTKNMFHDTPRKVEVAGRKDDDRKPR